MKQRTFMRPSGNPITVNDVDGLDDLAKEHNWEEIGDSQPLPEVSATKDAQHLAEASGVDISLVPGTGKDGKVLIGDVRAFIEGE